MTNNVSYDLSDEITGITLIPHGAKADSKPLNDNFTYLANKCDRLTSDVAETKTEARDIARSTTNSMLYTMVIISGVNAKNTITLEANKAYSVIPSDSFSFSLPSISDNEKFYQILVQLKLTDKDYISNSSLNTDNFYGGIAPVFNEGLYDILYQYDNASSAWYCAVIYKGALAV